MINLHKSSIRINRDADAALSQAVEHSRETLQRQHEEFALIKQAIQKSLFEDIKTAGVEAQSMLGKLMSSLDTGLQTALTKMASTVKTLENEISSFYIVRRPDPITE